MQFDYGVHSIHRLSNRGVVSDPIPKAYSPGTPLYLIVAIVQIIHTSSNYYFTSIFIGLFGLHVYPHWAILYMDAILIPTATVVGSLYFLINYLSLTLSIYGAYVCIAHPIVYGSLSLAHDRNLETRQPVVTLKIFFCVAGSVLAF